MSESGSFKGKEQIVDHNTLTEELTLALIYLTSWNENEGYGEPVSAPLLRAWKGYSWDITDKLLDRELVAGARKNKSLYLTQEGIEKAKEIIAKLEDLEPTDLGAADVEE